MKKLKMALVIPTHFDIHSSLNNLLKVYRHLIKNRNIEVTIFTDKKNDVQYKDFRIEKIRGVDYKTVLEKFLLVLGLPRFYYADLIEKLKGYDAIESSNPEFYWFAYQSYKAAKKYNVKLVYRTSQTIGGFYLFKLSKYFVVPIARKAYGYANSLLFTNPKAKERCVKLGLVDEGSEKTIVIGHATDTKTFHPIKIKKNNDKTILLSVGGLYKMKGHHLIIKALGILSKKIENIELWIVGEGYYKKNLVNLAKKLNLKNKVRFLGKKSHEELTRIYNIADIFVLANYQEITPAVNEALACEKPVVVMECGGRNFVIPDESYGLVARKFDIDDMAKKVVMLIEDRELAKNIAKKGRSHILRNFSVEKVAEKIYNSFK